MAEILQHSDGDMPAIKAAEVCKSFESRAVLEKINLRLGSGEGLCICGKNASGKTTLLRTIAGLLRPNSGSVEICGFDTQQRREEAMAMLGAVFHKSMIYPQLTIIENLRFFAGLYGLKNVNGLIDELLERTYLADYRYEKAGILSAGMLQRLALVRALIHSPKVLLADEPFSALDSQGSELVIKMLHDFRSAGGAILMTSHNLDSALHCCSRAAVLDEHKIIFDAEIRDITLSEFSRDYLFYARVNR